MQNNQTPPRLSMRFFRWYCHPNLVDHIEGDLLEDYGVRLQKSGKRRADIRFIIDVLLLFRPRIIKPVEGYKNLNSYSMYKSYFKIGWRNLLKNKGYSSINIGGLAIGMSVAMIIGLWVFDELTFNTYHTNYNTIGHVMRNVTVNGEILTRPYLPNNLGDELKTKYGNNFKQVVMAYPVEEYFLTYGEMKLPLRGEFMEGNGAELFTLPMVRGSRSGLFDPHTIFLSESTAKIIFGSEEPIDKLLKISNSMDVRVTGVYKDLPRNTLFHDVKFFAPLELLTSYEPWMKEPTFSNNFLNIYVQLEQHTNFETVSNRIKDAILHNIQGDEKYTLMNPQLFLHPMSKWHLHSEWKNGVNSGGLIQIVWLFGIVGVFVLILACINFMNLSTARSEKRAKEVGIRKSIGSRRTQLMNQFFSESFLVVFLSFIFSLIVVTASLPWFNELTGKQIEIPLTDLHFWMICFGFVFITGLLAGSYPAFYLSSFNAIQVLKGLRVTRLAATPRQIMVVIQFTVSVTLIIGTIIVYQQIQFAKNRPVGYNRQGLLMIQMTSPDFQGKYDILRTELKNTGVVAEMAESSSPPTEVWSSNSGFDWDGKNPAFEPIFATLTVTPEYGRTVGWQFQYGRDFSRELASDSAGFVINEAAAKLLGFKNPIGQNIRWTTWRSKYNRFTIIGVIKDMVMGSPYKPTMPALYFLSKDTHHFINIKINPEVSTTDALPKITGVFRKLIPEVPFDYSFADQEYALKFASEERIGKLTSIFSVLAIFISCLGLFGLASYVAEQRTKEIGIRKVMGASVFNLWRMLSTNFVILVIVSSFIALPVSYYFMSSWLQKYEYRTDISWWIFLLTCVGALVITLLTVSFQAVKAAMMNPVKSLRSE